METVLLAFCLLFLSLVVIFLGASLMAVSVEVAALTGQVAALKDAADKAVGAVGMSAEDKAAVVQATSDLAAVTQTLVAAVPQPAPVA
jgi:hypothetical protein